MLETAPTSSPIEALYKRVAQAALQNDWSEHRSVFRLPFNCKVQIGHLEGGVFVATETAWALDLSIDGIGLLTDRPFVAGIELHLQLAVEGQTHLLPIRVVSARPLFGQVHRLGALFIGADASSAG